MNKPLISTITPCFKMGSYLKLFLEKLPKQTFFNNLEVVLDHNEPSSVELGWVREFQKKYPNRLKHIIIPKVDPIGVSMNRCIRSSSADVLAMWNVDDIRTDDSIEIQYSALCKEANIGIVYGDFIITPSFGGEKGRLVQCEEKIDQDEFTRSMLFGPFFMFKKELCQKAGFIDEQLKSGADFDFSIRLALHSAANRVGLLGYYLNEGKGASTRPNSLQPLERTVIELRYGIYDKIDYDYAVKAIKYNIDHIINNKTPIHVSEYVPNYREFINDRYDKWHKTGLSQYRRKNGIFDHFVKILKRL